jgi:glycosyltransferase involved in cell wall biosynthesis
MEKPFRIAFLQCHKSTRTRNGINTFVENFLAMCDSLGIYVDVIMDRNDKIVFDYENLKTVNVIFPDFEYPDDKEQQLSGMFRYPISFSKILNCRMSLVNQMKKSVYDMVFINSEELIPVVAYTGIKLPVFVYSHTRGVWLEFSKNKTIFKDLYDMVDSQKDRMTMLTQTDFNVERFKNMYDYSDVRRVRMPMPSNIYHLQDVKKDGVIFIGRLSSSKRFEDYCKLIQMTGKKALIMTPSDLSQVKNVLDEYEITNYEIGQGLVGHARNVFMNRAEYCFHPAEDESFGFAPAEMSKLTTTFVLSCYD